jgi:hypothetical protein
MTRLPERAVDSISERLLSPASWHCNSLGCEAEYQLSKLD